MPLDHLGEPVAEVHQPGDDPVIEGRQAEFVAEHAIGQVGHLVGDDDRRAGAGHADHLPQGPFGIVEVVECADAQHGVELAVVKRQRLGLALDQPDRGAGRRFAARLELGPGDVDAHDPPVGRQPGEIDAVAHGHVEQIQARLLRQMLEHLVTGARARRHCTPR